MDWSSYKPLNTSKVIEIPSRNISVLPGDIFGDSQSISGMYLLTEVCDESVFVYNYSTGRFENRQIETIKRWMDKDSSEYKLFNPIISSHAFTIESESGNPVGVRFVGYTKQTDKLAEKFGRESFVLSFGSVFKEGETADSISEPFSLDHETFGSSFEPFADNAVAEHTREVIDRTGLSEQFARELLSGILSNFQNNLKARFSPNSLQTESVPSGEKNTQNNKNNEENMLVIESDLSKFKTSRNVIYSKDSDEDKVVEYHGEK